MAYLEWYGDDVEGDVMQAAAAGLNETAADCVAAAQRPPSLGGAPVVTGWLSGHITFDPAQQSYGGRVSVRWGNIYEPDYALIVNSRNPYLQRAADLMYPTLEDRIRENLPWGLSLS